MIPSYFEFSFLIWAILGLFFDIFIHYKAFYNLNYWSLLVERLTSPHLFRDLLLPGLTQQREGVQGRCAPLPPGYLQGWSGLPWHRDPRQWPAVDTMPINAHPRSSRSKPILLVLPFSCQGSDIRGGCRLRQSRKHHLPDLLRQPVLSPTSGHHLDSRF